MGILNFHLNKLSIRALAIVFALLASLLPLGPAFAAAHAKWTVMVYIAANNDLEPSSVVNLMEMAAVGSTDDVNIVVQITRPENYQGFYGEWGGTRRFLVTRSDGQLSTGDFQISPSRFAGFINAVANDAGLSPDQVEKLTRGTPRDRESGALALTIPEIEVNRPLHPLQLHAIEDLGTSVNSGDAATLADFGTWAVQNFPADRYGLVLWDHGAGWSMIASDDTLGPAGISMPALQTALDAITRSANQKLDFVGFDACLMSQFSVAATLAPFAHYQIAAEELVPGLGWDYTAPLEALVANPDMTAPQFARAQIDAFQTLYTTTAKQTTHSFDMGLLDLSRFEGLMEALNDFAASVAASPAALGPISTARANAQTFGSIGQTADEAAAVSSVDLGHFMRLLSTLSEDSAVKQSAQNVVRAIEELVVYRAASANLSNSTGLSVYFPQNGRVFAASDGDRYRHEFGEYLAPWQGFLDTLYQSATASSAQSAISLKISSVTTSPEFPGSIHDTPVITYNLDGANIVDLVASVTYQLSDQQSVVLAQFPVTSSYTTEDGTVVNDFPDGSSVNDFYWNPTVPNLSDGINSLLVLMTSNSNDDQHGFIRGAYTNRETGRQSDATLMINLDTYESSGLWASSGPSDNTFVAQIFAKPGDTFEPAYLFLDASGNSRLEASGTELVFGKAPLQAAEVPGPDGTYFVTVQAVDAAGTASFDTAAVDIFNSNLDDTLQGFKDIGFGLSFLYPSDWTSVDVLRREDGIDELYVTNLSGDLYLSALNFTEATSLQDMRLIMENEVRAIAVGEVGEFYEEAVGYYPGISLSYAYARDDKSQVLGAAVAVYVPETSQGYLIFTEFPPDQIDTAPAILDKVLQSANFFRPAE